MCRFNLLGGLALKKLALILTLLITLTGCSKKNNEILLNADASGMLSSSVANIDPNTTTITKTVINSTKLGENTSYSAFNLILSTDEELTEEQTKNLIWLDSDTLLITSKASGNKLSFYEITFSNHGATISGTTPVNIKNDGTLVVQGTGFAVKNPHKPQYTLLDKKHRITKQTAVSQDDLEDDPYNFIYANNFSSIAYLSTTSPDSGYGTTGVYLYDTAQQKSTLVYSFSLNTKYDDVSLIDFTPDGEGLLYMKKSTESDSEQTGGVIDILGQKLIEYPLEIQQDDTTTKTDIISPISDSDSFVWLANKSDFESISNYQTNAVLDLNTGNIFDLKLSQRFCSMENLEYKRSGLSPQLDNSYASLICFYNDGNDNSMFLYDIHSGKITTIYTNHPKGYSANYSLSPDGTKLVGITPTTSPEKYTVNYITLDNTEGSGTI